MHARRTLERSVQGFAALLLLVPATALLARTGRPAPWDQSAEVKCKRNETKYRSFHSENYSSVPCDVPCWSRYCVEVGGPCEDPSGFMCDELEFTNVAYGDAAEPVFIDDLWVSYSIEFPFQEIPSLWSSLETIGLSKHDPQRSASVSRRSAVPLEYLDFSRPLQTPAVDFDTVIKGASMMISHCKAGIIDESEPMAVGLSGRLALAEELMKYVRVDSFGKCLHNRDLPADAPTGPDLQTRVRQKEFIAKKYLFNFAFENSFVEDYVTEKFWDTLRAGTLPVYFGAPNIWELMPMKAFVNAADFKTAEDLGNYLKYLTGNKTAYMEYHIWRLEPLPRAFKEKWRFARVHRACRACRWGYAKREMLTWDSEQQRVAPPTDGSLLVPDAHRRRRSFA